MPRLTVLLAIIGSSALGAPVRLFLAVPLARLPVAYATLGVPTPAFT